MDGNSLRADVRWLAHALGRNPLRRGLDRVAAFAILVLLGAAVLMVPAAIAAGNANYAEAAREAAVAASTRRPVEAVVTSAPVVHVISGAEHESTSYSAEVSWTGTDGRAHVNVAAVPAKTVLGGKVRLWVDTADRITVAPPSEAQLRASAGAVAFEIVVAGELLCAGLIWCVRGIADACAERAWNREWEIVEPKWLEH
ncbi:Rv1733c family protein [Saccharopolyspora hattusasensis]|uniref:Rv1733c family protein n=1 Tax=Saccharopolyspora hattusasensis TaxID=1128679 RepID=UPI003D97BBAB